MKRLSALLMLVCFITVCNGQTDFRKGYVITHGQDTLSGLLDYQLGYAPYKSCDFKRSKHEYTINYAPSQITGYGFVNDKYFKALEIEENGESKLAFLEVIVSGHVSLYRFEHTFLVEKDNQGLQALKNESQEVIVNDKRAIRHTNQHIAIMNMLLFDCVELRSPLKDFDLKERIITELVETYNKCKGLPGISYKINKPWFKLDLALTGGISTSQVKRREYTSSTLEYEVVNSPMIGLSLDVSSPRLSEGLHFHSDLFYLSSKYYRYNFRAFYGNILRAYTTIELQSIKIPLGLRYTFPERKITTFLNGGISNTFHLATNTSQITEVESNSVVETFYISDFPMEKNQIGFWFGLGGIVRLPYKFKGVIELRYENTDRFVKAYMLPNVRSLQLILALRIK